jgi:hypothetical protein
MWGQTRIREMGVRAIRAVRAAGRHECQTLPDDDSGDDENDDDYNDDR